jgi:hypothetical protein
MERKGKERHGWGNPFKKPRWAGFTTGWVKGWSSAEAVRELLQNLFDQAVTSPPSTGFKLNKEASYPGTYASPLIPHVPTPDPSSP